MLADLVCDLGTAPVGTLDEKVHAKAPWIANRRDDMEQSTIRSNLEALTPPRRTFLNREHDRDWHQHRPVFYIFQYLKLSKWLAGFDETTNYEYSIPLRRSTPDRPKMRKRDRDRAEARRLAGGPKPSLRERAVALAQERGVVRTRDLTDIGVPRCYLARMCDEGLLVKVG